MANRNISSTILIAVVAYSVLIVIWFFVWLIAGDINWWLVLTNRLVPFLFIPLPILLALTLFARRAKFTGFLLIPMLLFVWLYQPYLIPRFANNHGDKLHLKVMTYNVLFSNFDYDAVADVVLTYQPDLVALQEVQPEMMSALEERLGDEYPYSLMGTENDFGTTAVFSRQPFIESFILDLQSDRPAVIIKTKIQDEEITFVSVHLLAYNLWWTKLEDIPMTVIERTFNQNRQAIFVLEQIKEGEGTVIIGCDCNSYETSSSYRIFDQWLDNSARDVGWLLGGGALPGTRQDTFLQHIDYVWYRGSIEPAYVFKIKDSGGSDHLPVLVIFEMN